MRDFSPYIDPKRQKSNNRTLILMSSAVLAIGLFTGSYFALVMGGLSMTFSLYTVYRMRNIVQKTTLTLNDNTIEAVPPIVATACSIPYAAIQELHMDRRERLSIITEDRSVTVLGLHHLSPGDRSDARKEISRLSNRKIRREKS